MTRTSPWCTSLPKKESADALETAVSMTRRIVSSWTDGEAVARYFVEEQGPGIGDFEAREAPP